MGVGCSAQRSASLVQLNKDHIPNYKIILIGDPGVGKTNIMLRYTKNQFDYSYKATQRPSIESVVRKLNVPANVVVSVTLWDLPGREDMDLRATYFRNVDAVLIVVDMSDEDSIEMAGTWRQDFLSKASRTYEVVEVLPSGISTTHVEQVKDFDPSSVPMLLLGNKYDLVEDRLKEEAMKKMLAQETTMEDISDQLISIDNEKRDEEKDRENHNDNSRPDAMSNTPTRQGTNNNDDLTTAITHEENDTDSSSEDEEIVRIFQTQKGQYSKKDVPHCVNMLERLEVEKGYTGSIIMSAKDKDGSVDAAIQSMVRHLLDKSNIFPKQHKKPVEKKKRIHNKLKKNGFQPLKTTGVPDIDSLFARSNVVLKRVLEYTTYYQVALHKFKQGCADLGMIREPHTSLDDCVIAVRDTVKERMKRELILEEEEGFVYLHYDVDEEDQILLKQLRLFVKLLHNFHHEYCAISRAVLRDSPSLEALLTKLDSRISTRADETWAEGEAGAREKSHVTRVCNVCEKNRARIAHAHLQVAENVRTVETAREKIKAALMW